MHPAGQDVAKATGQAKLYNASTVDTSKKTNRITFSTPNGGAGVVPAVVGPTCKSWYKETCCTGYPSVDRQFCMGEEDIVHTAAKLVTDFARSYSPWKVTALYPATADSTKKTDGATDVSGNDTSEEVTANQAAETICGLDKPCNMMVYVSDVAKYLNSVKVVHPLAGSSSESTATWRFAFDETMQSANPAKEFINHNNAKDLAKNIAD